MVTITIAHKDGIFEVLFNGAPVAGNLTEGEAVTLAYSEYRGPSGPKRLTRYNGDTQTETVIMEADAEGRRIVPQPLDNAAPEAV